MIVPGYASSIPPSMFQNLFLLALCQAFMLSSTSLTMTTSALVGLEIAPSPNLATLPLAIGYVTVMVCLVPVSIFMQRHGRRAGFAMGAISAMLGGMLSCAGIYLGIFALFCSGSVFQGIAMSTAQFYRFAAVEVATDSYRNRAISWVLLGGLAAAFLGPSIARYTQYWFPGPAFSAAYASIVVLGLGVLACLSLASLRGPDDSETKSPTRRLPEIMATPTFMVAALCAMIAYGSMNLLMTATPLAMNQNGMAFEKTVIVIQLHIVGMFAPSFFTGHLIDRFGVLRIMFIGTALLAACALTSLEGNSYGNFLVALALLGTGWNFLFIGGTTLLTEVYRPEEKGLVQGVNDLLVFTMVAATALLSGLLHNTIGWQNMNKVIIVAVLLAAFAIISLHLVVQRRNQRLRSEASS